MPTSGKIRSNFSLYIHVPFCIKKCDYCHFYVVLHREAMVKSYLQALEKELLLAAPIATGCSLETIYFGGGTPSLLPPDAVQSIIERIFTLFSPSPGIEITLEANPEQTTLAQMQSFYAAGINRISFGVQSFDDAMLQKLSRAHSAKQAEDAVLAAYSAGINNISIDLMYDLPSQTVADWQNSITKAASLPISHISLYNLTIEPFTAFHKKKIELEKAMPGELLSASLYSHAIEELCAKGFHHYEISAFARPHASNHNSGYWLGRPFLGLGPSAYSFWKGKRWRNIAQINRYMELVDKETLPIDYEEELPYENQQKERLVIALRMLDGIDEGAFVRSLETEKSIENLIALGYLERTSSRLKLTRRGIFCYDAIAVELI
jgi:oxygen-independent coproporphyrinogen-3 oxidase